MHRVYLILFTFLFSHSIFAMDLFIDCRFSNDEIAFIIKGKKAWRTVTDFLMQVASDFDKSKNYRKAYYDDDPEKQIAIFLNGSGVEDIIETPYAYYFVDNDAKAEKGFWGTNIRTATWVKIKFIFDNHSEAAVTFKAKEGYAAENGTVTNLLSSEGIFVDRNKNQHKIRCDFRERPIKVIVY